MKILKDRIEQEGKHLGKGILKVDGFMNHQIDPVLMKQVGEEFARRFAGVNATRILTAETSGIAPALSAAVVMQIPLVFARKHNRGQWLPNRTADNRHHRPQKAEMSS